LQQSAPHGLIGQALGRTTTIGGGLEEGSTIKLSVQISKDLQWRLLIDESSASVEHGNRYTHSNTVIRNRKDLPSFREE
jgi:hypothetical protein